MLKNTHDVWFSWGGGYAMAYLCYANSDNSWKNDLGQVYNKAKNALWWLQVRPSIYDEYLDETQCNYFNDFLI